MLHRGTAVALLLLLVAPAAQGTGGSGASDHVSCPDQAVGSVRIATCALHFTTSVTNVGACDEDACLVRVVASAVLSGLAGPKELAVTEPSGNGCVAVGLTAEAACEANNGVDVKLGPDGCATLAFTARGTLGDAPALVVSEARATHLYVVCASRGQAPAG